VEATRKRQFKMLAYASRYGRAGEWMLRADSDWLRQFCEAIDELVTEENAPRS
jgi:hypothetical protein